MVTLSDIVAARRRLGAAMEPTPCQRSAAFAQICGCDVWFKFENLLTTGSFKERGALNKLLTLTPDERARGVIAASAGNHAQGVAYHAGRLGIAATIVMPETTPLIKISATRGYGAQVILHGASFDEAYTEAQRLCAAKALTFVHPFDDDAVIAGQGTIGLELLEQVPDLEAVVVSVGGGGLIGGVAVAIKESRPNVRIVGVESAAFPKMQAALAAGAPITVPAGRTIADGIAARRGGDRNVPLVQRYVDDLVTVDDEELANAILLLLEREKTVTEGAGAVGVAALVQRKIPALLGKRVVAILSGGNIDVTMLSRIIERGLAKDGRLVKLVVTVADRPGTLAQLATLIAKSRANVLEIFHNRLNSAIGDTEVELKLETRGQAHIEELIKLLADAGYAARREI